MSIWDLGKCPLLRGFLYIVFFCLYSRKSVMVLMCLFFVCLSVSVLQYATGEPLTSPPYLLEGGYAMWYLTYGVTCVGIYRRKAGGGDVATPPKTAPEGGVMDYPSFPDIK